MLLLGENGGVVLVDGGPDPGVVLGRLAEYGIRRIDLVVLSHPHEDHAAGLVAVVERLPVSELWHPGFPDGGATFDFLADAAAERGVEVSVPAWGTRSMWVGLDSRYSALCDATPRPTTTRWCLALGSVTRSAPVR